MAVIHTSKVAPPIFLVLILAAVGVGRVQAQRNATAVTDPSEARAINAIFSRWRIRADDRWNISGDICSGIASDSDTPLDYSPGIKCDCSYNSSTICHVYSLRVYSMSDWDSSSNVVGELPEELWSLTYLTNLNLGQNYLTGTLPPSIGTLTRLQYLSIGINALSGELPKELGLLLDLRSLAIGTSNFSGSLPPELGNCTRLEELWIDSSGVSGAIPLSFAGLQNMKTMFAPDVAFTGQIPDFIGTWSNLTVLRLEGNSFQGPIPSSFSNLRDLTDLRISDLSNGNSSLDFLTNLRALTTLSLRNNNISASIPSNFNEYPTLSLVDLSFNNFTGQIPDSLFNMSSLVHLFLGNNKLTGSLPAQKTSRLQFIDLSYNELSGSYPSWVSQSNLQLNLVANNFSIEGSNSSVLASGLNCLQRNFPCFRGDPQYSRFAVKCGGVQMSSATGIVYEADTETLGPAAYHVSREQRWAVSNVGLPSGSRNPEYKTNFVTNILNTRDPELYQDSRVSAGSLRYYGLGLQNGGYNISLQFVETKIENSDGWKSLGRRIFDIYIQGNLAMKDFDIQREAGGSLRAVVKDFSARVTQNHLEIHLFWAGKGTCCVPAQGIYGPSIAAISVTAGDFIPTVSNNPPNEAGNKKNSTGIIVGIVVSVVAVSLVCFFAICYTVRRRQRQKRYEDEEFLGLEARPFTFTYAQLRAATEDFSAANKLGEGGFGPVYMGTLEDGRIIAVKQLSVASHQGKSQFLAEIETISAVQHRNLVKLYGCCIEGNNRLLVYEYLEKKSLDQALFGSGAGSFSLDWPTRLDICLGVARGLAYLHEESRLRIVHRDVKASNILLDSQLNPKLSDFGLAKLYDDTKTHMSTRVAGTIGYLAPEYAMRGHLTEKADVFGFGVVALEIVSGRPNSDSTQEGDRVYLLEWAWHCHENDSDLELVDQRLSEFNKDEARRLIGVALLCSQTSPVVRPSMSRVVAMLSGDAEIPAVTSKPGYLTEWNFSDISTFTSNLSFPTSTPSASTTKTTPPCQSPIPASEPMLQGDSGEGR